MPKATAKAKTRPKPTAKQQVATFKPIAFSEEIIMVKGGFTTKDRPAIVRTVEEADGSRAQFLKVTKQEDWLYAAAFGDGWRLLPTRVQNTVVDEFRNQLKQYSDGDVLIPADNDTEDIDPHGFDWLRYQQRRVTAKDKRPRNKQDALLQKSRARESRACEHACQ